MQEEKKRYLEATQSHQAALAAVDAHTQQTDELHAAMLADVTAAHQAAMASALSKCAQAEALIEQLRADHAEEIVQCDAEFEEAHMARRLQAIKVGTCYRLYK